MNTRLTPGELRVGHGLVLADRPAPNAPSLQCGDRWITQTGPILSQLVLDAAGVRSWVDSTPGGAGSPLVLVYTDGPILAPGEFNSWPLLYAVWSALATPAKAIMVQCTNGLPLVVPAAGMPPGGWIIGGHGLLGAGLCGFSELAIANGAMLVDACRLNEKVGLVGQSSSACLAYSVPPPGGQYLLALGTGCTIRNDGPALGAAMFRWSIPDFFIVACQTAAEVRTGANHRPVFDVAAGSALGVIGFEFSPGNTTLGQDTLAGDLGAQAFIAPGVSVVDLRQADWNGSALASWQVFQPVARPRCNIQTDPITAAGPYGVTNGSEFVRLAPDGIAPQLFVNLPDATLCPDETVIIKKVNADLVTLVEIRSSGGNIDGNAPGVGVTWPALAYYAARYTSDGVDWWST